MRELRRLTGLGMGSLQAELKRLVELELLSTRRDRNRVMYRLEHGSPRWRAFELLLEREVDVLLYAPERAQGRARKGSVFLQRVLSKPKLWVAGSPSVLDHITVVQRALPA